MWCWNSAQQMSDVDEMRTPSMQVQAPEAAAAPHSVSGSAPTLKKAVSSQAAASMDWPPVPSAAGRELEMVETVSDQPSCHVRHRHATWPRTGDHALCCLGHHHKTSACCAAHYEI